MSADLSPQLRKAIEALSEEARHPWKQEAGGRVREWAEAPYVPSRKVERKDAPVYRYVAVRVRPAQGQLWEEGVRVRHFAVASNQWEIAGSA